MIKKRILSALAALTMAVTIAPSFTENVSYNAIPLTAVAASEYTIPELDIQSKGIPDMDSFKFVSDMTLGWNLGNTFDATDDDGYCKNDLDIESSWCGVKTTKEMIDAVKAAGFKTLRLPVSWHNHIDDEYQINEAWLNRVQEVMDYAIDNDMYVILNIHHDNETDYMYPSSEHAENSIKYVTTIWEQLSEKFKSYDEHLIFETLNEPRLKGDTYEWWLNMSDEKCIDSVQTLNSYNQAIVDTIRKSGGNNAERYIMVPGYDASLDGATNNYFKLPTDSAENKLIVSIHAYSPYNFALQSPADEGSVDTFDVNGSGAKEIDNIMDTLYVKYVSKNIPVVVGEFGARAKGTNVQARTDYATYYIAAARARGITCCWWDNNAYNPNTGEAFGLLNRSTATWAFPSIVEGLNKYSGNEETIVVPPTPTEEDDDRTSIEGEILPSGTINFKDAIGDKIQLTVDLGDGVNYANGCLGFNSTLDGTDYWIAYQWEATADGEIEVDMTKPQFVKNTSVLDENGDPTDVEDEEISAALISEIQTRTSCALQYWYAADSSWTALEPASDYATITKAVILKKSDWVKGDVLPTGTISFDQVIGDKLKLEVEVDEKAGYVNGCIGFSVTDTSTGKKYWISYKWEASASDTITINMNSPFQIVDVTDSENTIDVEDEELREKLIGIVKSSKSASIQFWWASDASGEELSPASDYATLVSASVKAAGDTPSENYVAGDANCDGNVDISDAVMVKCYLINNKKYTISEQGIKNADVQNAGGGINAQDAVAIQKYVLHAIKELPIAG